MKTIELPAKDWYLFKLIAKFEYSIKSIKHTVVTIEANAKDLESLGY